MKLDQGIFHIIDLICMSLLLVGMKHYASFETAVLFGIALVIARGSFDRRTK